MKRRTKVIGGVTGAIVVFAIIGCGTDDGSQSGEFAQAEATTEPTEQATTEPEPELTEPETEVTEAESEPEPNPEPEPTSEPEPQPEPAEVEREPEPEPVAEPEPEPDLDPGRNETSYESMIESLRQSDDYPWLTEDSLTFADEGLLVMLGDDACENLATAEPATDAEYETVVNEYADEQGFSMPEAVAIFLASEDLCPATHEGLDLP